ncbi:MAG TPA: hypothetical protein ENJ26_04375 [Rhodobacteraceae bacterium]|nr:hypothetical protein [Paracoccaceae bacterium]
MRLICPNCGAQYEVDPGVIPETGRDVQCSNCGHSWFQRHDRADQDAQSETTPETQRAVPDQRENVAPEPEATPDTGQVSAPEANHEQASEPETTDAPEPATSEEQDRPAPRSAVNEDVASILQEEAAREKREREAATGGLETQPELGLEESTATASAPIEEQIARLHEMEDQDSEPIGTDAESSRKEVLPDIEEINSTLSAESANADGDTGAGADVAQRNGFRRGFLYAVSVFALMALVYVFAPKIADMIPATAKPLSAYVEWINGLRAGLDSLMLRAVEKLTGLLDNMGGSTAG